MKIYHERGYLPHLTPPGGIFFITAVLKGTLPAHVVEQLREDRAIQLKQLQKEKLTKSNSKRIEEMTKSYKRYFLKVDNVLDKSSNQKQYLKNKNCANILADKIKQYDGEFYTLIAYCIMSNHFHLLIDTSLQLQKLSEGTQPTTKNYTSLSKIMQLIKGASAYKINQHLGRKGAF